MDVDESHYYFEVHLIGPSLESQYEIVYFLIRKQDFIIDYIWLNVGNEKSYHTPEIFMEFGITKSMYHYSYSRPSGYNIWLYLYYPEKGFISSYLTTFETTDRAIRDEEICFQRKYIYLYGKRIIRLHFRVYP
jgi:hypothetical protein